MARRAWVILFVVAWAACSAPPPKKPVMRYTPARTLYLLKLAYNTPDPSLFPELFAADFVMEAERPPAGGPARWGATEEVAADRAVTAEAYQTLLEMNNTDGAVGKPDLRALTYETPPLEMKLRVWRDANYCYCVYGFVVFELERADENAAWKISKMVDKTGQDEKSFRANAETEVTSWAAVKWRYLNAPGGDDGP